MTIWDFNTPREIYFIKPVGQDGPIKIGCSSNPRLRLGQQMAWSAYPLEIICTVPGTIALEKNIHECFIDCHSHGEWFHATPRLLTAIARIAAGVPISEAVDLNARQGRIHSTKVRRSASLRGTSQETVSM